MHRNGFDSLHEKFDDLKISKPVPTTSSHSRKTNKPPLDNYYAVNAPAPGTVGVASARINKPYTDGYRGSPGGSQYGRTEISHLDVSNPLLSSSKSLQQVPYSSNIVAGSDRAVYVNVNTIPQATHYNSYGYDEEFPRAPYPEELGYQQRSPSPVSSSYAELRNTHQQNMYHQQPGTIMTSNQPIYAPLSQMSSTYESIYEPLIPRPNSGMSQVSSQYHGPYSSPLAKGLAPEPSNQPIVNPDKLGKEAEVDALTNLLVQSMDSSSDPEFFGICARCGDRVMGEGNGCTAMEQVFHIQCFSCIVCLLRLQGKPFYALDSKPYCEDCYLNTLEKCCVCMKPILDRILRATGKPYHPLCFTCVVCKKSLDGIPFTIDASNQIHCIDDFHKKFAPRCSVCAEPIMPEAGKDETVRVVALDRSFHVGCYKCEDCGLVLSSDAEGKGCYPLDNHVLCKSCNAFRVQNLTSKVSTEL